MSNLSIKTEQIVSNTGTLSIEVFKNFELPDNSKLHFNCHGQDTKSIFFNCPNGGITYDSLNYNITSDRINIKSRDNIQLKSYNKINIESLDVIEIGNYQSSILINSKESFLNLDFTERKESSINILDSNKVKIRNSKIIGGSTKSLTKIVGEEILFYNSKIDMNMNRPINSNSYEYESMNSYEFFI